MENKYKFGYEDSDKVVKVDIYGLEFKVNDIKKEEIEEIQKNENDEEKVDKCLKQMLGEDAIEKINKKRKEDGYEEMDIKTKVGVLAFTFQVYCEELVNNVQGLYDKMYKSVNNVSNYNRQYIRNNKYRKNRRY
jgi:hypothetical protein